MSIVTWFLANWQTAGSAFLAVWGALSLAFRLIAPLTSWTWDDKAAGFFTKVEAWLTKMFVPAKYTSLGGGKGGGDKA